MKSRAQTHSAPDVKQQLAVIRTETLRDLHDRAPIATRGCSFARIGAALKMKIQQLRPEGAGLHQKGGKHHIMPCHHLLAEGVRACIDAASIAEDCKGFRSAHPRATSASNCPAAP